MCNDTNQQHDLQQTQQQQSTNKCPCKLPAKPTFRQLWGCEFKQMKSISYLAKISMLSALAVILLMLEFPIFPATPHLKMNFSDLPALLASFMFGPFSGVIVNGAKIGIGLLIRGTSTAYVGDLSNLISGTVYAFVAGAVYLYNKNKKGAIVGLAISSVLFCGIMWICNQYFLLPMFKVPEQAVPAMMWWTLLFNVIKTVATAIITFIVYKSIHRLFNRF